MGLQKIVIVAAGAAVAFATAVGCGSDSKPAAPPSPAASDEQQIRELLEEQEAAFEDLDFARFAELTCTKYRQDARKQLESAVPPISEFGTAEELAGLPAAEFASGLKEQFPTASQASIDRLVDTLVRYDEAAYQEAIVEVIAESSTLNLDKVENIKITGETATADITSTSTLGTEPPETKTETVEYVKEGGQWKECEAPSA